MRKLLFSIVVGIAFIANRSVAQTVQLQTSAPSVDINATFGVTVRMSNIEWGNITIDGLEPFQVIGQSTSNSVQIINGVSTAETVLQLQVRPNETWVFTIGPARVSSAAGEQVSNTVEISVEWQQLFWVNSVSPLDSDQTDPWIDTRDIGSYIKRLLLSLFWIATVIVLVNQGLKKKPRKSEIASEQVSNLWSSLADAEPLPSPESPVFLEAYDKYLRSFLASTMHVPVTSLTTMTYEELLTVSKTGTSETIYKRVERCVASLKTALYAWGAYDPEAMVKELLSLRHQEPEDL